MRGESYTKCFVVAVKPLNRGRERDIALEEDLTEDLLVVGGYPPGIADDDVERRGWN